MAIRYIDYVVYYNTGTCISRSCSYVNVHFEIYRAVVMIVNHFAV